MPDKEEVKVNEGALIPALIRHQKAMESGGMIFSEEQLEFLEDVCQNMAIHILSELLFGEGPKSLEDYLDKGTFKGIVREVVNEWKENGKAGEDPCQNPYVESTTFLDHMKNEDRLVEKNDQINEKKESDWRKDDPNLGGFSDGF